MKHWKEMLLLLICLLGISACMGEASSTEDTTGSFISEVPSESQELALPPSQETLPVQPQPMETEEPLPDRADSDFVAVRDYIPDIAIHLRYATHDNFTGQVIYDFQEPYLRYGTVKKLMQVQKALAEQGFSLKIWDAFRPASAQYRLWEICPDPSFVADPNVKYSTHTNGNTVDVTLVDEFGREPDMPTDFDDFSSLADRDYSDCPDYVAENALLLQGTMEKFGFSGYSMEWWHFSDTQQYPAAVDFDPGSISVWYADCREYINLRISPDYSAESIAQILAGERLTVLGFTGEFAFVQYDGLQGYVAAGYIQPCA